MLARQRRKVNFLLNSVISTPNVKLCGDDIKDFYLNNIMETLEYMRIKASLTPEEIMQQYQLVDEIHNGFVYMEIRKGMHALPQSSIIDHT